MHNTVKDYNNKFQAFVHVSHFGVIELKKCSYPVEIFFYILKIKSTPYTISLNNHAQ